MRVEGLRPVTLIAMANRRGQGENQADAPVWEVHLGNEELVIRQRYEVLSICNDVLIGIWFLIGSFLFFNESTARAGTWLFVFGSIEMLVRPVIRLTRRIHLHRFHPDVPGSADAAHDF